MLQASGETERKRDKAHTHPIDNCTLLVICRMLLLDWLIYRCLLEKQQLNNSTGYDLRNLQFSSLHK